jgi:hypothetical protein
MQEIQKATCSSCGATFVAESVTATLLSIMCFKARAPSQWLWVWTLS